MIVCNLQWLSWKWSWLSWRSQGSGVLLSPQCPAGRCHTWTWCLQSAATLHPHSFANTSTPRSLAAPVIKSMDLLLLPNRTFHPAANVFQSHHCRWLLIYRSSICTKMRLELYTSREFLWSSIHWQVLYKKATYIFQMWECHGSFLSISFSWKRHEVIF